MCPACGSATHVHCDTPKARLKCPWRICIGCHGYGTEKKWYSPLWNIAKRISN